MALVTGGTSRLGAATAKGLAASGRYDKIIIVGRSARRAEAILAELRSTGVAAEFLSCDLASLEEVRALCSAIRGVCLRSLVCLAGVTALQTREETPDGHEYHFGLNFLSRFSLVNALIEELASAGTAVDPSRIILVSSNRHWGLPLLGFSGFGGSLPLAMGSVDDLDLREPDAYAPWKAFGQAALCNVLFAKELQRRLKDRGLRTIAVSCFDPGPMATAWDLYRKEENRMLSSQIPDYIKEFVRYFTRIVERPEDVAATPVHLATSQPAQRPGQAPQPCGYWERGVPESSKYPLPWSWGTSEDRAVWAQLWALAETHVSQNSQDAEILNAATGALRRHAVVGELELAPA